MIGLYPCEAKHYSTAHAELRSDGLPEDKQITKKCIKTPHSTHSARNLRFILDKPFTFLDQTSALSRISILLCCHGRDVGLRCIRPYIDSITVAIVASAIVSEEIVLRYCNSPGRYGAICK